MSKFTDIFIRRPVLATVISLLIFIIGLRAIFTLPVRQFPKVENTLITVVTSYPGAAASLVQGFITTPLEKEIAGAAGLDYLTSTTTDGTSTINAYIRLNFDPNTAYTNVLSKVQEARQDLPKKAEVPVLTKTTGSSFALMYIGFNSKEMSQNQITDYLTRVVQPKLETIPGVSQAEILGGNTYAMRIWLNTKKMAGLGVTPNDVYQALLSKNILAAAGHTKGKWVQISIKPTTDLSTVKGFDNIVIKAGKDGSLVHLKDIAKVELGSQSYESSVTFNAEKAVFMGITDTPTANPLTVITDVKKVLPTIIKQFPPGLHAKIVYDSTTYIRASIREVVRTIFEASIIVILVIYLFLGSLRTVVIPIVTIPLSLVGVFAFMSFLGYSINLLTLLALVLAIGMVVDDAIVVVENVYRHIEEGLTPFEAAIKGAREIATAVITMSITLAAVYAPIGFMHGITGALFKEFAFTLASAVILSGVIALTLSPMMCSKFLSSDIGNHKFVKLVDSCFDWLKRTYMRWLTGALKVKPVTVLFAFVVLTSCAFLYINSQHELAPQEDQGVVFVMATGPQTASLNYMERFTRQFNKIYKNIKSHADYFIVNGESTVNATISGLILKPWDERKQTQKQVNAILQKKLNQIGGLQIQAFPLPSLPVGGGAIPLQFEITSTQSLRTLYPIMQDMLKAARDSGKFLFIVGSLKFNKPQLDIQVNRDMAAQMGIGVNEIAQALATSYGGYYVNWFSAFGRSYQVIPQVADHFRSNPEKLDKIYLTNANGNLVPLSTLVTMKYTIEPNALTRFQQLNSVELQGMMRPGYTLTDGLNFLINRANKTFPSGVSYNFAGLSRQTMKEKGALLYAFFFSIIIIFLVLSAQFESFRDPLVVMTAVPMAICGALLVTNLGLASINIYTQIGIITLIGLISKHGILMVDFANQIIRDEKLSMHDAIVKSASIRLRPVLMTTFSMVLGVVPLILATGAGAVSRFDIGLVIAAGMLIGTLFTLFVVPTMYMLKTSRILLFLLAVGVTTYFLYFVLYVLI